MSTRQPAPDLDDVRRYNTRNTDTADFAAELQEEATVQGVARARQSLLPEQVLGFDGLHCACGDEIPEARLAMHRVRCVACQTKLERNFR